MSLAARAPPIEEGEDQNPTPKPKGGKRSGACNACKKTKVKVSLFNLGYKQAAKPGKCDGLSPCGGCRRERNRAASCVYSEKALSMTAARNENERRRRHEAEDTITERSLRRAAINSVQDLKSVPVSDGIQKASMHRTVSLCGLVEEVRPIL